MCVYVKSLEVVLLGYTSDNTILLIKHRKDVLGKKNICSYTSLNSWKVLELFFTATCGLVE